LVILWDFTWPSTIKLVTSRAFILSSYKTLLPLQSRFRLVYCNVLSLQLGLTAACYTIRCQPQKPWRRYCGTLTMQIISSLATTLEWQGESSSRRKLYVNPALLAGLKMGLYPRSTIRLVIQNLRIVISNRFSRSYLCATSNTSAIFETLVVCNFGIEQNAIWNIQYASDWDDWESNLTMIYLNLEMCCEVTTKSTRVGYLMYLGNSNGVLLVLILSCCEDESMLLA
jgi:hypothetical protein